MSETPTSDGARDDVVAEPDPVTPSSQDGSASNGPAPSGAVPNAPASSGPGSNGKGSNGKGHDARIADVRLTGDRLVVRRPGDGERTTNSGLLIPATAAPAPRRLTWGDVALAGPDVRVAKVGDRVLFLPQSGLEVELDGEDLVLLRERDVQAVSSAPTSATERVPGQYL